jgi:hypothetical protein
MALPRSPQPLPGEPLNPIPLFIPLAPYNSPPVSTHGPQPPTERPGRYRAAVGQPAVVRTVTCHSTVSEVRRARLVVAEPGTSDVEREPRDGPA